MPNHRELSTDIPVPLFDDQSDDENDGSGAAPLLLEERGESDTGSRWTCAAPSRSDARTGVNRQDDDVRRATNAATAHAHQMIFEDAVASMCQASFVFGMVAGSCMGLALIATVSIVVAHKTSASTGWDVFSLASLLLLFAVCILAIAFFVREISKGEYRHFGRHYHDHRSRQTARSARFASDV